MAVREYALLAIVGCLLIGVCDCSNKFLHEKPRSATEQAFKDEIMNAMGSVLGCGGEADHGHVAAVRKTLMPMWLTIPKTQGDRIDRRSMRYLVHRYFMQTSSLMVKGFEPTRATNDSHWGSADILSQMVPAYVESVLESQHSTQNGFSLQDVVDMVLTLDQLIFDSESAVLEDVYKHQRKPHQRSLSFQGMKQVLDEYMVKWMVDADAGTLNVLLKNRTFATEVIPHYNEILKFAEGQIKTFDFKRQQLKGGRDAFATKYSFEDAHKVVGGITRSFQSYWQSECSSMKESLMDMDKYSTGRVPLAKFYNTAINSDWRFGESEAFLRELGALDESSSWMGPQVIIPNYLQATSNCTISTSHYSVCCVAECESLLGELESAIKSPTALPSTILAIVRNMTSQTTLDHDEPAHLDGNMVAQLEQVAKSNGGKVPLHGRLFAQWLHYVFPHECPYPHLNGAVSATTISEFGDEFVASKDDMQRHASNTTALDVAVTKEDLQWMSQWNSDEELMLEYKSETSTSWRLQVLFVMTMLLAAVGYFGGLIGGNGKKVDWGQGGMAQASLHSHYV